MKYSSTSRLTNAIIFPVITLLFGFLGVYFSFVVAPTYLATSYSNAQTQLFTNGYAYNFAMLFGVLGLSVAFLGGFGTFLAIKALSDSKDAAVRNCFLVYIAIGYVFVAYFAANALVFYRLIGGAQFGFWIVLFVILLVGALVASNIPMTRLLEKENGNVILLILASTGAVITCSYLLTTVPTLIVSLVATANKSGNYIYYTNQLWFTDSLALVAFLLSAVSGYFFYKGVKTNGPVKKVSEILADLVLLPVGGAFLGTGIFEYFYMKRDISRFSLEGIRGAAAGVDYIVMTMIVGSLLIILSAILTASSLLPEKKKEAK